MNDDVSIIYSSMMCTVENDNDEIKFLDQHFIPLPVPVLYCIETNTVPLPPLSLHLP